MNVYYRVVFVDGAEGSHELADLLALSTVFGRVGDKEEFSPDGAGGADVGAAEESRGLF